MFARLPTKPDAYRELINKEFGSSASRVLETYPAENAKQIRESVIRLLTDLIYCAEARLVARSSAAVEPQTYKYVFSRASRMPLTANAGAHHGCEIPFVFGVEHPLWNWTDRDRELSGQVREYWINFAKSGDPNGGSLPKWPAYSADTEQTLEIGDAIAPLDKYRHAEIDVIAEFLKSRQ
jgi:para-nitrobenzyl esterase